MSEPTTPRWAKEAEKYDVLADTPATGTPPELYAGPMTEANLLVRPCRNTVAGSHKCHPYYAMKYDGYCLECANAGVPELEAEVARLRARNELLERLVEVSRAYVTNQRGVPLKVAIQGWDNFVAALAAVGKETV